MRLSRITLILLSIAVLTSASFLLAACGSGGGGGDGDRDGGTTIDNSRATGTYTFVYMAAGSLNIQIGTITFDGAGGFTFTNDHPAGPSGSDTYTIDTNNTLTLTGPGIVGTMRSDGTFFAGNDTRSGNEAIMLGIKHSSGMTDTQNTYLSGQFMDDSSGSMAMIIQVDSATPSASTLTWAEISPGSNSGTETYTLNTDGTISIPGTSPYQFGAVSSDKELIIVGDTGTDVSSPGALVSCGLKFPGSGMADSSLNGAYMLYQFMDDDVDQSSGGPSYVTSRSRVSFNGVGSGSYTELSSSLGSPDPGGTFTYAVDAQGTFTIDGVMQGTMLADGSVFGIVDYDDSDDSVAIMIGVKQ